ncbi:hypothetical protein ACE193_03375 [Bernardetia sp. OM2101]|uniref:hypothetical protein n=1 Tax=Bernardetia sp. OM2101 TaxID=3344876 RepID=UPI0035D09359
MKNLLFSFTLITFIMFGFSAKAQNDISFSFKAGVGAYSGGGSAGYAAVLSPRLNFLSFSEIGTLSVGTHIGLGYSSNSTYNSRTGAEGQSSFVFDLPVMLELNLGNSSSPDNESDFGGFVGAGYGFSKLSNNDLNYGGNSATTSGPVLNAGLSYRGVGVRFSYLLSTKDAEPGESSRNVLGLSLLYTLK